MIEEEGNDPFLKYALSLEYSSDIQFVGKAIETLQHIQTLHPEYLPTYYQLAVLLKKRGEEQQALIVALRGKELAVEQGNKHTAMELEGLIEDME